jgi:hemerythrin superfamily protein
MSTITAVITDDHNELKEYYENIMKARDDATKIRWQNQFTWELARHSIGEELVVYPAMEKLLANGKNMADKDREQHQNVSCVTGD